MKKLLLISLFSISLLTQAQDAQTVVPGSYTVALFQDADYIEDEQVDVARESFNEMFQELASAVQTCINETQNMPLSDYFKEFGAVISRICKDEYGDNAIAEYMDDIKFFCLPKLFDEKVKQPLFKNVFEQASLAMQQRHEDIEEDSYFYTFSNFLKQNISLQELITDADTNQEQAKREVARFELIQCMIGLSDYLVGEDELKKEYLQEIVHQTEKLVKAFKITLAQRAQANQKS